MDSLNACTGRGSAIEALRRPVVISPPILDIDQVGKKIQTVEVGGGGGLFDEAEAPEEAAPPGRGLASQRRGEGSVSGRGEAALDGGHPASSAVPKSAAPPREGQVRAAAVAGSSGEVEAGEGRDGSGRRDGGGAVKRSREKGMCFKRGEGCVGTHHRDIQLRGRLKAI